MNRKYKKSRYRTSSGLLKTGLFILLSFMAIVLGIWGGNFFSSANSNINLIRNIDVESFKSALNKSLPIIDTIYNSGNVNMSFSNDIKNLVKKIFDFDLDNPLTIINSQSPVLTSYYKNEYQIMLAQRGREIAIQNKGEEKIPEDNVINPPENQELPLKQAESSISTEEGSEERDFSDNGKVTNGGITLQNDTKLKIDINALLKEPLKLKFEKNGPQVLIYHTHTTESYINNIKDLNKSGIPNWTLDSRYGVVRVGEELAQNLRKEYGLNVIHNGTINDYPDYNSSYHTALETVNKILKGNPSIQVVLDIHRDGLAANKKLRVVSEVKGKNAAQIMFVMGTNATGLQHPNWKENLKFAMKIQEKLNSICPGLAKPIYVSKNRYNQHVRDQALIIEIGGDGNTLEESLESTKYLAKAISEVIKGK